MPPPPQPRGGDSMNGEGSVSALRALDSLDRRKGDKRMADTRYHVSVCRIYKVTNNGGGGGAGFRCYWEHV